MVCKGTKKECFSYERLFYFCNCKLYKAIFENARRNLILNYRILHYNQRRINEKSLMFLKFSASYGICCEPYHTRASKKVAVLVCFINCLHTRQKCFLMKCKTNLGPIFHNINSTFIPSPDIVRFKQLGRFYVLSLINNYF